jgi:putative transcriptional regulator
MLMTCIKEHRERLGMTQSELAKAVGVRRETIVHLENGRYNPSLFLAYEITQVFNKMLFKGDREQYFVMEDIFIFDDDYY